MAFPMENTLSTRCLRRGRRVIGASEISESVDRAILRNLIDQSLLGQRLCRGLTPARGSSTSGPTRGLATSPSRSTWP